MLKRLLISVAAGFIIVGACSVRAHDFQKVDALLFYWYNVYFDEGYLEELIDSLSELQPITHPNGLIEVPFRPSRTWNLGDVSESPAKLIDGVPHVTVSLGYNGDRADLDAIGVVYSVFAKESAIIVIPLENLPELDSLSTVISISSGHVDVVQADNAVPLTEQSIDTVGSDDMGTILVKLPHLTNDPWFEFSLIEERGNKGKLTRTWMYECQKDESGGTEIALPVPALGTYQLIAKCASAYSRIVCFSGIEVIKDSASLVYWDGGFEAQDSIPKVQFQEWRRTDTNVIGNITVR